MDRHEELKKLKDMLDQGIGFAHTLVEERCWQAIRAICYGDVVPNFTDTLLRPTNSEDVCCESCWKLDFRDDWEEIVSIESHGTKVSTCPTCDFPLMGKLQYGDIEIRKIVDDLSSEKELQRAMILLNADIWTDEGLLLQFELANKVLEWTNQ